MPKVIKHNLTRSEVANIQTSHVPKLLKRNLTRTEIEIIQIIVSYILMGIITI